MNRKMIRADKANTGTKLGATHLSTIKGDAAACGTEAEGWTEVAASYDYEVNGETFTKHITVDCKKCRKFAR